jgi:hypothetical protein
MIYQLIITYLKMRIYSCTKYYYSLTNQSTITNRYKSDPMFLHAWRTDELFVKVKDNTCPSIFFSASVSFLNLDTSPFVLCMDALSSFRLLDDLIITDYYHHDYFLAVVVIAFLYLPMEGTNE